MGLAFDDSIRLGRERDTKRAAHTKIRKEREDNSERHVHKLTERDTRKHREAKIHRKALSVREHVREIHSLLEQKKGVKVH